MHRTNENVSPKVLNAVLRQVGQLGETKLDGVHMLPNAEDPLDIQAIIEGPTQTPYEGGQYRVKIILGAEFPTQPPRAFFLTRIFHPNISAAGDVCVNTLKRDWNPNEWQIGHILQVIRCLLIVPFPESALNEEAGRLFMESYQEYYAHAKMINSVHAMARPESGVTSMVVDEPTSNATSAAGGQAPREDPEARRKAAKEAQKAKARLKRL